MLTSGLLLTVIAIVDKPRSGRCIAISIVLAAYIGFEVSVARAQSDNLIVPGVRIGRTHVRPDGSRYLSLLPKPEATDAAMSHLEVVWVSQRKGRKPETLFLAMTRSSALNVSPSNGLTIEDIRVTSPVYRPRSTTLQAVRVQAIP